MLKSLQGAIDTQHKADDLISDMFSEIVRLRYLVYRYHQKYGIEVACGGIVLGEHEDFTVNTEDDFCTCHRIDHNELGFKSKYQCILKSYMELSK
jgi:hypothetical protein